MMANKECVRLSITLSVELNDRLEQLAAARQTTKTDIFRRAIALYYIAVDAKAEDKCIGILDQDKQFLAEIVGI
jgi:predicted transcriptional regulator